MSLLHTLAPIRLASRFRLAAGVSVLPDARHVVNIHPANSHFKTYSTNPNNSNMSYSNTDTGSKPADPYTAKNADEPGLKDKIGDLVNFVEQSKFGMMTTHTQPSGLLVSRAMALAGKEGNGIDLIFHTNTESGKTDDLTSDPKINIAFINSSGEWASISGEASVEADRSVVHKFYSPDLKAWMGDLGDGKHDGGPDDPRIGIIRVKAITASYAINGKSAIGQVVDVVKGAITGETPAINKLRHLDETELKQWRATNIGH